MNPESATSSPPATTARNLCVFCDGTGAMLGDHTETNVVRLANACRGQAEQLVFYDPGVGTASALSALPGWPWLKQKAQLIGGLAFGDGVFENIAEAYRFLMDNYQCELAGAGLEARSADRIFLFGFSRGAFTARALGGMVAQFGIVGPESRHLVDYMVRLYFSDGGTGINAIRDKARHDFTTMFQKFPQAQLPVVHFVGAWDTVASVGIKGLSRSFSGQAQPIIAGKRFVHVRHAVARDEYRAQFEPRLYEKRCDAHQTLKQKLFAGVHTDIGGGYVASGLSDVTLDWMSKEAHACLLRVNFDLLQTDPAAAVMLHDEAYGAPYWSLTGLSQRTLEQKDFTDSIEPAAIAHGSIKHGGNAHSHGKSVWESIWTRPMLWLCLAVIVAAFGWANMLALHCNAGFSLVPGASWLEVCTGIYQGGLNAQPQVRAVAAAAPELMGGLRLAIFFESFGMAALLALSSLLLLHARMAWLRTASGLAKHADGAFKIGLLATWAWLLFDVLENSFVWLGTRTWWWQPEESDLYCWLTSASWMGNVKLLALLVMAGYFVVSTVVQLLPRNR